MKRRLILFATTLGFLLLAFAVYYLVAGAGFKVVDERDSGRMSSAVSQPAGEQPVKPPMAIMRDEQGRLEGILGAESWDPAPDGSYHLTKPYAQFFQTSRRELRVAADRGTVYVEETARGLNVRRGTLEGDVRVLYDRATDVRRDPAETRPEEFIRIHLDQVQFDNDLLEMTSDSQVTVFAAEADIIGKGLTVSWNEEPAELRLLKIHHGGQMVVKKVQGLREVSLPGGSGLTEGEPTSVETNDQLPPLKDDERLGPLPFEANATSKPASHPATRPKEAKRRNIFRATFTDNVEVFSSDGRIEGADRLSLAFEWDRKKMEETPPPSPAESTPSTAPDEPSQDDDEQEPITIVWSGPLVLEPEGHTEEPSTEHFRLDAQGKELRLCDNDMTVNCGAFVYQSPQQAGRLTGRAGEPVSMTLAEGSQQVTCHAVRFNQSEQLAELVGPGSMSMQDGAGRPPKTMPASQPTTIPSEQRRITWREGVIARIGSVADESARSGWSAFISEAIFRGGVEMSDDGNGSFVHGDTLHVSLSQGEQGPYPSVAKVVGNVSARQDDSDISADEVIVNFAESPVADIEPGQASFREVRLVARRNVRVTDRSRQEPAVVHADTITVALDDPDNRRVQLLGKPAGISQGPHRVSGNRIELNEEDESAGVIGAGSITFVSDRDPQGRKLDKPRPVEITWSDSMDYDGLRNEAAFKGSVKLTSGLSRIECDNMTAAFKETDTDASEAASDDGSGNGSVSFDPASFGRGQLVRVIADGEVLVVYETVGEDGKLLQAMQLRSDNLAYDAEADRIDCTGYGLMVVEDYSPSKDEGEEASLASKPLSRTIKKPWQTVFEWRKMMRLMLANRMVIMDGGVVMIHHSGSNIPSAKDMRIPDWSGVTVGRTSTLGCEKLMAEFAEPDQEPSTEQGASPAFDPGSNVGDLEMFVATGQVVLEDRDYELRGAQLSYLREKGFAILWGYLDGQPAADAYVYSRGRPVSSPKFLCRLKDGHVNKVTAMDVTGSGSR